MNYAPDRWYEVQLLSNRSTLSSKPKVIKRTSNCRTHIYGKENIALCPVIISKMHAAIHTAFGATNQKQYEQGVQSSVAIVPHLTN